MRRELALMMLVGLSGAVGCKSAPWSSSPTPAGATTPNFGQFQFESLSKAFSHGETPGPAGGPVAAPSENFFVSSWKKTSAALAAPFATSTTNVASDDPVSLSSRPKKVGPELYVAAAQMMENQGKFDEAESQYLIGLKSSPNDLNSLVGLARLYDRQGESSKAVETYRRALKAHPNSALVYNDLGLCYARQESHDQAAQYLTKAVDLDPDNARYRNNLATVLVAAGDTNGAVRQLAAANSEAVAHYNVACLLQMQGRPDEAVQYLHLSLERNPNLAEARQLLTQMGGTPRASEGRVAAQTVSSSAPSPARASATSTISQPQHNSFSPWR